MRLYRPLPFGVLFFLFAFTSAAQSVSTVSLGPDVNMPCNATCTNLSATINAAITSTSTYTIDSTVINYNNHYAYTGGSSVGIPVIDDRFSSVIALPFTFCFYGAAYNNIVIGTNGIVSFNVNNAGLTCTWLIPTPITTTSYYSPSIMPAFHDIDPEKGGSINYYTQGVAPNRVFVVNYSSVPHWPGSCNTIKSTFQLVLHENTNIIDFYLQDKPTCTTNPNIDKAAAGIQNSSTVNMALPGKTGTTTWGSMGMNKAYRFIPSATPHIPTAQLLNNSSVVATGVVSISSPTQLTANFGSICPSTDISEYVAKITYTGCANFTIYDTVKVFRLITQAPDVTSPIAYCQGFTATPLTALGSNLLWYTSPTSTPGSPTAPTPTTTTPGPQTYYVTQTVNGCESVRVPITVNINPTPATPTAGNNSPICVGSPLNLTANSATAGANYTWSGPSSFSSSLQNPGIANAQTIHAGVYSVTASLGICSTAAVTTTAVINTIPVIASVSGNNPTACGGANGSIALNGLNNSTAYSVMYLKNGVQQPAVNITSNGSGVGIITSLTAGNYTDIIITLNNCSSSPAGPVLLQDPAAPVILNVTGSNPSTCTGADGNIVLSGLVPGATYTVNFTKNSNPQATVTATANGAGQIIIPNLGAGTYAGITVTINACTSAPVGPTILADPNTPVITAGNNGPVCQGTTINFTATVLPGAAYSWSGPASFTSGISNPSISNAQSTHAGIYTVTATVNNCTSAPATTSVVVKPLPIISNVITTPPSTCNNDDGSIALQGLISGNSYTVNYTKGGIAQPTQTLVANSSGAISLLNLTAGVYNNIIVSFDGCNSLPVGPYTLSDPLAPIISTISNNGPLCSGSTLNLAANAGAGATYNWTGPASFSSASPAPSIPNTQLNNAGVYTVTATKFGCTSVPATTTVVVSPTPAVTSTSQLNPTTCLGTNGSITLNGLTAGTTYTVDYFKNGSPVSTTVTADASGALMINGLSAATYTGIVVELNTCNTTVPGTFTLTDPAVPATPIANNNTPVCAGETVQLTASTINGVTYTWAGPNSFNSNLQTPTIVNAQTIDDGLYSVTVTVNNCTSAAATTDVVINPVPATPVANSNSPICSGGTINLTATSSTGVGYTWSGPASFTASTQNPTIPNAQSVNAGLYTVTASLNGCVSDPGTTSVVVNPTPVVTSTSQLNPTTCLGTNGSITLNGLTAAATYTIDYFRNGNPVAATITANSGGTVVINGLNAATYTGIVVTLNGCNTTVPGTFVLTEPSAPPPPAANNNSPVCAGATVNLTASTVPGAVYTWTGPNSFNSNLQNPTIANAQAIHAGSYSVTVTVNNCTSIAATTSVVVNPIPITPVANSNTPVCSGGSINLTATSFAGAGYTWSGPASFAASTQNPTIPNAQLVNGGLYTVTANLNGCVSTPATTSVIVNPTPVVSSTAFTHPTTCTSNDGTISLNGLVASTSYTINYLKGSVPQTATIVSNGAGTIIITGLGAGNYDNITASLNGCTSNASGPIILVNPTSPTPPVAGNNGPACQGGTINLTATLVSGTYAWTGPNSFNSNAQNPTLNNIQPVSAGVYTVTVTLNGCTSVPATTTVVVNPTPATPVAGSNGPICEGSTLNLTASTISGATYTWTGPNTFTSTSQNPIIAGATIAATGIYSVRATVNNCISAAGTTNVIINPIPAAPVVTNASFCQNATATPLTATGSNLLWYTLPTGGTSSTTAPTPVTTTPGVFTWYVSQTVNGCESPRATVTATIITKPAPPTATTTYNYCQGQTATQLTATGTALLWYTAATGGTGAITAPTPSTAAAGTFNFYVSQTINTCESDRTAISVIVTPTPAAPVVSSPVNYCQASPPTPALATFVTGSNILWYTSPTSTPGSATAPVVNTGAASTTTYYVSQTVGGCESGRTAIAVNVIAKPIPPQVVNITYCQSASPTALTATGSNLLWYTTATGGIGSLTAPTPSTATVGITNYYVSQTLNGCESDRAQIAVTVDTKSALPTASAINYCQFESTSPLTATGSNLLWYAAATGGIGSAIAPTPSSANAGTFTWYVTQKVNNCESDRLPINVTVSAKPSPPGTATVNYCDGDVAAPLTASGQNLLWYKTLTGGTGTAIAPTPSTASADTQYNYVSQTINGCESNRAELMVVVSQSVTAGITAARATVCEHDTTMITFTGTAPQGATYEWDFAGGAIVSGSGAGPYVISWNEDGQKNINVTVRNVICTATASLTISVSTSPEASFSLQEDACIDEIISLQATSISGARYNWNFDNATVAAGTGFGPYRLFWSQPGDKRVTLTVTAGGCASLPVTKIVNVHNLPLAKIDMVSNNDVCTSDSVQFKAKVTEGYIYEWSPPRYFLDNNSSQAWAQMLAAGYIQLKVFDTYGCSATDSVFVNTHRCCQISIPNAFSPNNDGRNDNFRPLVHGYQQLFEFKVVNRWGQLVYKSSSKYDRGWDGTLNGVPQDAGTYYYFVQYQCADEGTAMEKGEVILVR